MSNTPPWPFDRSPDTAAITTVNVLEQGYPVLVVQHFDDDGSWAFLCGLTEDSADGRLIHMEDVLEIDHTLATIADLPRGWIAHREAVAAPWQRELDDQASEASA